MKDKVRVARAWAVVNTIENYLIRGLYTSQPLVFMDRDMADNATEDRKFVKVFPCEIRYRVGGKKK